MSVLVPLNNYEYLPRYLEAGADQFYCGFYDQWWDYEVGADADINRMSGFGSEANAYSFDELLYIVREVRAAGRRIYVPFNAATYTKTALEYQAGYFEALAQAGADGVIISMPEQVRMALNYGLDPVVSTMGGVYHSLAVAFWKDLGARRIILPRDLSLDEIEDIISREPSLEYEVFMMRNGCIFSDSHCLGMHGHGRGALCSQIKTAEKVLRTDELSLITAAQYEENSRAYCTSFHRYTCGLCALYRLSQLGVAAYKIVGRGDDPDALCADVRMVQENLAIALECKSQQEYLDRMKEHPYKDIVCPSGLNCYYPEVRFSS